MTQLPIFGQPIEPTEKPAGDQAVTLKVLITVKATPNPSDKYGETVCVAGLSLDPVRPGWIRLYPINFRELGSQESFKKYDIVTVKAVPARQDSRRESWRPQMPTLKVTGHLKPWAPRRSWLDPAISTDTTMCKLNRGATMATQSLALLRPRRITDLRIVRHPRLDQANRKPRSTPTSTSSASSATKTAHRSARRGSPAPTTTSARNPTAEATSRASSTGNSSPSSCCACAAWTTLRPPGTFGESF
ncbi:hypothetical protein [Amycolatopsis sp. NPDC051128]|uniref:hypothetical protein n=1 Tax=Amycolatopsis sp. NPDC051128 TaxID=3155412 RepID=UPI003447BEB1